MWRRRSAVWHITVRFGRVVLHGLHFHETRDFAVEHSRVLASSPVEVDTVFPEENLKDLEGFAA